MGKFRFIKTSDISNLIYCNDYTTKTILLLLQTTAFMIFRVVCNENIHNLRVFDFRNEYFSATNIVINGASVMYKDRERSSIINIDVYQAKCLEMYALPIVREVKAFQNTVQNP